MAARPVLLKNASGALAFTAPEGSVSESPAPAVALFDEGGDRYTASSPSISRSGAVLSVALPADLLDNWGDNYRACWTYTAGGAARLHNQTFEVVSSILFPTLSADTLTARYAGLLKGRQLPAGMTHDTAIAAAWDELLQMVRVATGRTPHLIIDSTPLEAAHAHLAASLVASNFGPGSRDADAWQQWAATQRELAQATLEGALQACTWYDRNADLRPTGGSMSVGPGPLWFNMSGKPIAWPGQAGTGAEQGVNVMQSFFTR